MLSLLLVVELAIDWQDLHFALESPDGAHDRDIAVDALVDDVLYDKTHFLTHVVVGTYVFVYLVQLTETLGQVQTGALDDSLLWTVHYSLK